MKKRFLKWLGFDVNAIQTLQNDVKDLQSTISNLKTEATDYYKKIEDVGIVIKMLDIDKKNEFWWEDRNYLRTCRDFKIMEFARNIQDNAAREWVNNHPSVKVRKIFHGGCLGCATPLNKGIGVCLGCSYFGDGCSSSLPDLSTKEKQTA